jgi:hypothetical protein
MSRSGRFRDCNDAAGGGPDRLPVDKCGDADPGRLKRQRLEAEIALGAGEADRGEFADYSLAKLLWELDVEGSSVGRVDDQPDCSSSAPVTKRLDHSVRRHPPKRS